PSASASASAAGAACGFWAGVCLLIYVAAVGRFDSGWTAVLAAGAVASAAGAWRWGFPAFALIAAAFGYALLARVPAGRWLWLGVGAAAAVACVPFFDRKALAPSHRRCVSAVFAVSAVAVYAALNPYSMDENLIEAMAPGPNTTAIHSTFAQAAPLLALASAVAAFLVVWGIRTRPRLPLRLGPAFSPPSLVT